VNKILLGVHRNGLVWGDDKPSTKLFTNFMMTRAHIKNELKRMQILIAALEGDHPFVEAKRPICTMLQKAIKAEELPCKDPICLPCDILKIIQEEESQLVYLTFDENKRLTRDGVGMLEMVLTNDIMSLLFHMNQHCPALVPCSILKRAYESYYNYQRLMLIFDIETNPGPEPQESSGSNSPHTPNDERVQLDVTPSMLLNECDCTLEMSDEKLTAECLLYFVGFSNTVCNSSSEAYRVLTDTIDERLSDESRWCPTHLAFYTAMRIQLIDEVQQQMFSSWLPGMPKVTVSPDPLFVDKMEHMCERVANSVSEFGDKLDGAAQKLAHPAERAMDGIASCSPVSMFRKLFELWDQPETRNFILAILACSLGILAYKYPTPTLRILAGVITVYVGFTMPAISGYLSRLMERWNQEVEQQSFLDAITEGIEALATGLGSLISSGDTLVSAVTSFMKKITSITRPTTEFNAYLTKFFDLSRRVLAWLGDLFHIECLSRLGINHGEIKMYAEEVRAYIGKLNRNERFMNEDLNRFRFLSDRLLAIEGSLPRSPEFAGYRTEVNRLVLAIHPLLERANELGLNSGDRTETVLLVFRGPPGTGKSFNMKDVAEATMAEIAAEKFSMGIISEERLIATVDNKRNELFVVNKTSSFWEGYWGQSIVLWDELHSIRPGAVAATKHEGLVMMELKNTADASLDMAFSRKGMNFFTSDAIIATSNSPNNRYADMDPESEKGSARRYNNDFVLVPREEFCKKTKLNMDGTRSDVDFKDLWSRSLDPSKVPNAIMRADGYWEYDTDISECIPWDAYRQMPTGESSIKLSDIPKRARLEWRKNYDQFLKHGSHRTGHMKRIMKARILESGNQIAIDAMQATHKFDDVDVNERAFQVRPDPEVEEQARSYYYKADLAPALDIKEKKKFVPRKKFYNNKKKSKPSEVQRQMNVGEEKHDTDTWTSERWTKVARELDHDMFFPYRASESLRMEREYPEEYLASVGKFRDRDPHQRWDNVRIDKINVIKELRAKRKTKASLDLYKTLSHGDKVLEFEPIIDKMHRKGFSDEVITRVIESIDTTLAAKALVVDWYERCLHATYSLVQSTSTRLMTWVFALPQRYAGPIFQVREFVRIFLVQAALLVTFITLLETLLEWIAPDHNSIYTRMAIQNWPGIRRSDKVPGVPDFMGPGWSYKHKDNDWRPYAPVKVSPQMYTWSDNEINEQSRIAANTYKIFIINKSYYPTTDNPSGTKRGVEGGSLFFGGDRVAVCFKHIIGEISKLLFVDDKGNFAKNSECEGIPIELWLRRYDRSDDSFDIKVLWADIVKHPFEHEDKVILVFPTSMPLRPNLLGKIPSRKDEALTKMLYSGTKLEGKWLHRDHGGGLYVSERTQFAPMGSMPAYDKVANETTYPEYYTDTLVMNYPTVPGDCGGLGLYSDTKFKDIGHAHLLVHYLHVAGHRKTLTGIGVRLWREDFLPFVRHNIDSPDISELDKIPFEIQSSSGLVPDHFMEIGPITPIVQMKSSSIERTPLHGKWCEVTKKPARLRPYKIGDELIMPFWNAREGYCANMMSVNHKALNEITDVYTSWMHEVSFKPEEPVVLTFDEAVLGKISLKVPALDRKTSPGYIFNRMKAGLKQTGKKPWFGDGVMADVTTPEACELRKYVDERRLKMLKGKRLYTLYLDCLKDERLKKGKGARMFCGCEMDFLILCKMYYGHFATWIVDNRVRNNIAVGINPYSIEWTGLFTKLVSTSGVNCIFGDVQKYDKHMLIPFMYAFFKFADGFYYNATNEDKVIRKMLAEEFINSIHVAMLEAETSPNMSPATVYEWLGANTSGNFLTAILNSVVNDLKRLYCVCNIILDYKILGYNGAGLPVRQLLHDMPCIYYGDDSGMSVSDELVGLGINQVTMSKSYKECLGLTFTDDAKTGVLVPYRPIEECTFISRGFRRQDADMSLRIVAPLKLDSIVQPPFWRKRGVPLDNVREVVQHSLLELSLHGEEVFDEWAPKMIKSLEDEMNLHVDYQSFGVCFEHACRLEYPYAF